MSPPFDPLNPNFQNPDAPLAEGVHLEPAPARAGPPAEAHEEKWAFESRTIQRMMVAGLMFLCSQKLPALLPYLDQGLVGDVVRMAFDFGGTLFLGAAARARQIATPERLYWLPRPDPTRLSQRAIA